MHPKDALARIAFLLETGAQPGYRVRAFRRAAASLADVSDEQLARLAAQDRLKDLPGVGDVMAEVIKEALNGETPKYLQRLEDEVVEVALDPGVAALLASLKGDCHTHSEWSDGGNPIEEMARTAIGLGHDYIVLTDHSPRLTVANGLSPERLRQQLDIVAALNKELAPFRILTGIEVDILADGSLDQTDELLSELDVVVASSHSLLRMEHDAMTERMLTALANPHLDILGHCTGRLIIGRGRPESTFDAAAVFAACAQYDKAIEINSRPERLDPPIPLLTMARDAGCRFSIDSDAHAPGQMSWLHYGAEMATKCSLGSDRIVNSMDVPGLLAWTASHEKAGRRG